METQSSLIINDVQGQFYDPRAWEVMLQIGEHVRPDVFVANGDMQDFPSMSIKYVARNQQGRFAESFKKSVASGRARLSEISKRVTPKPGRTQKKKWNDGNHEWRIFRALHSISQMVQLLELSHVAEATSIPGLLGVGDFGFRYSGEYPAGCWLYDTGNPNTDVWVEHSYIARSKAGYTATSVRESRMTNILIGHVEKLALSYKHVVGGRNFFAIENGNLNVLGVPKKGDKLYSSSPFNVADYADRQQGVTVIYKHGKELFPQVIPIVNGKAVFDGRVFAA